MKTDRESLETLKELFKENWKIDLNIYEDQYHKTDMWFDWNGSTRDIEVKRRRFNSNKYPTTIVNLEKYYELINRKAILVVMFDDCWYICKDVKKAYVATTSMYARQTTDFGGKYRWSDKIELDLTKFARYEYNK